MPSYAPGVLAYAAYSALLIAAIRLLPDGLAGAPGVRALLLRLTGSTTERRRE